MIPTGLLDTASTQVLPRLLLLLLLLLSPMLVIINQPCLAQGKPVLNLPVVVHGRGPPPHIINALIPGGPSTAAHQNHRDSTSTLTPRQGSRGRGPSRPRMLPDGPTKPEQQPLGQQLPHPARSLAPGDAWNVTTPNLDRITGSSSTSAHEGTPPATTHAQRYNYERHSSSYTPNVDAALSSYDSESAVTHDSNSLTTAAPQAGDGRIISERTTRRIRMHRPRLAYLGFGTYAPGSRPTSRPGHPRRSDNRGEHASYFTSMVILISVACFLGGVMLSGTTSYCLYQRHCLSKVNEQTAEDDQLEGPAVLRNTALIYNYPPPNLDNPKANLLDYDFLFNPTVDKDADLVDVASASLDDDDDEDDYDDASSIISDRDRYSLVTPSSTASNSSHFSRESPQQLNDFLPEPT